MSSFSCQYIDSKKSFCIRLKKECIPGRNGCVLKGRFEFAIPAEKRIADNLKFKENNQRRSNKKK